MVFWYCFIILILTGPQSQTYWLAEDKDVSKGHWKDKSTEGEYGQDQAWQYENSHFLKEIQYISPYWIDELPECVKIPDSESLKTFENILFHKALLF